MLFNSISFLLFFPIVCLLYFCIPVSRQRARNLFLLGASYYFYMNWEPVYALLLLTCTVLTYWAALGICFSQDRMWKRTCFVLCVIMNLAALFLFKYYDFFSVNVVIALQRIGLSLSVPKFTLLLPIGISFYTFQALGYSIDVYRGTQKAERDFLTYALFVSFFPQLVAGPIERSSHLLPQFRKQHYFQYDNVMYGFKMMLWGYFMKLLLADRCGLYVDAVFNNVTMHNGGAYLLASFLFPFQIYGDFAGYSLIAIGAARVMGFRLMENFHRPYFSCSVGEFWHRWHISLSTWLKDYIYIPLGGSRVSRLRCCFNLMVTFGISGLWHGANWTFFFWGILHGAMVSIEKMTGLGRTAHAGIGRLIRQFATFVLISLAWVMFRANNLADAMEIYEGLFARQTLPSITFSMFTEITLALTMVLLVVWRETMAEFGLRSCHRHPVIESHVQIVAIIASILLFGVLDGDQFIYFQF